MRIQHNILAMNAYRNYTNNVSAMKKNLEKLSSGYKINRAGDDAAGLAISEKMRAQITGLETAQKNAKDGISLIQTAEGALTEVHDMLNRMVELATQSANGTYDNEVDRAQMQKEIEQLKSEINRIADSSNFNGIKLLDGSLGLNKSAFQIAADPVAAVDAQEIANGAVIAAATGTNAADRTTKTVFHKAGKEAQAACFTIDLSELDYADAAGAAGHLKIQIAGATIANLTMAKGDKWSAETIAGKLEDLLGGGTSTTSLMVTKTGTIKKGLAAGTGNIGGYYLTAKDNGDGTVTFTSTHYITAGGAFKSLEGGKLNSEISNAAVLDWNETVTVAISGSGNTLADGVNSQNVATTVITNPEKPTTTQLASTIVDLTSALNNIKDGTQLVIGDKTLTFAIGKDSTVKTKDASGNAIDGVVDLTSGNFANITSLGGVASADQNDAMAAITRAYGNDADAQFTVGNDGTWGKITVFEKGGSNNGSNITDEDTLKALETRAGFQSLIKLQTGAKPAGAQVTIDANSLKDGDALTIGGKRYVFVEEGSSLKTKSDDIKVSMKKDHTDAITNLQSKLTENGYSTALNGTTLTVYSTASDGSVPSILGNGLTLQIGDTAEPYNQLNVAVEDAHTKSLGINDIDIGNQDGAAKAVDMIKAAINKVSDIRGTLGATQNRLDHTINNLSVMTENIQDAESTIRDTDIAAEMMAYTKNNILIQSAQAMLAQANQVPQGVLQLLQ